MQSIQRKESLIVFTKPALPGRTKTRLSREIGVEPSLELYRSFLMKISDISRKVYEKRKSVSLIAGWAIDSTEKLSDFPLTEWLPGPFLHTKQFGNNLGERMLSSLGRRIIHQSSTVLIGTDIPEIDEKTILDSFESINNKDENSFKKKGVIGPSEDGGFYLIGMNTYNYRIFEEINWDSKNTFKDVINNLKNENFSFKLMSEKIDVDFSEDINKIFLKSKQNEFILDEGIKLKMEELIPRNDFF